MNDAKFTGSLWKVKDTNLKISSPSIVARPRPYLYYEEDNHILALLTPGMVFLVGSEPIPRENPGNEVEMRQSYLRVLSPVVGYMNMVYFNKDSVWVERIS